MSKSPIKSKPTPARTPAARAVPPRIPAWLPALLLALATVILYWPATQCGFVNYDDPDCVTENYRVQSGLNWESFKWAFQSVDQHAYWAPLMWLSHMLACQLFGLNPWGHHLINVLLHAANTALVFLLFRRMTGATWRSVILAALFGWHPLRVESVAWVTERKDVLSGFFGLLALIFYTRYAGAKIGNRKSEIGNYLLSLLFFALGLMSKQMLVTWPFVMLLLDYWPLERFKHTSAWRLVVEKIPFFVLAAAAGIVIFVVQKHGGAVASFESLPLGARCGNALISYCRYLGKMIWPANLAVFYPHPGYWPLAKVLLAGGCLCGISVLFFMTRRRYPFLLMGWLWYVGTLVPVIGLVQAGRQAMADRFTYMPSLGVLILAIWGIYELTRRWRHHVLGLSLAGSLAIILCMALTRQQLGYWRDTETLFRHALAVTENNYVAHNCLGLTLADGGQLDEAFSQLQEAIRLKPGYSEAHTDLGFALVKKGRLDEAISQFQEAIRLNPDNVKAHYNLGTVLGMKDRLDEAISQFQEAIRLAPDDILVHNNLGTALDNKGQFDEAIAQYQEAIRLKPDYAEAHNNLGNTFLKKGQVDEAISQYQETIRLQPDNAGARNNLARALEIKNAPAGR